MRKDYHIHQKVVLVPEKFELFVKTALDKNIKEICITDHMPLSVSKTSDRIPDGMVGKYCSLVRELAKKYEDKICIRCGIEVDFHPSAVSEIESVLDKGDFDFILASSHMHVFITDYSAYTFNDFASASVENSIKAAEMGIFHGISHPDMYRWVFENPQRFPLKNYGYDIFKHKALFDELLDKVAKNNMYFEINPHLAVKKQDITFVYPETPIVQWAIQKGVRFSYGSDAHNPDSVGAYLDELEAHPLYGKALKLWEKDA